MWRLFHIHVLRWLLNTLKPERKETEAGERDEIVEGRASSERHYILREETGKFTKSSIFWDIAQCSPLKINRHFRKNMSPPSSWSNNKRGKKPANSCLAHSSSLQMKATCSCEKSVDYQRLHDAISQKIELFITTAVRTSKSIEKLQVLKIRYRSSFW
jgi:hypothetical protein